MDPEFPWRALKAIVEVAGCAYLGQALVAAFTLTGLYLGMMVDERERAAAGLRQSLRLAAAGETAGAIAHEVNQPLTAIANYASASLRLMQADRLSRDETIVAGSDRSFG